MAHRSPVRLFLVVMGTLLVAGVTELALQQARLNGYVALGATLAFLAFCAAYRKPWWVPALWYACLLLVFFHYPLGASLALVGLTTAYALVITRMSIVVPQQMRAFLVTATVPLWHNALGLMMGTLGIIPPYSLAFGLANAMAALVVGTFLICSLGQP